MGIVLTCDVTQLLYETAPPFAFAHVVADLQKALVALGHAAPNLTWDCDDIALLDFRAGRIILGFAGDLPGQHSACLTIAVGQPALSAASPFAPADSVLLGAALTRQITDKFPCDAQKCLIIDQPLTADLIDRLVDGLCQPLATTGASGHQGAGQSALPAQMPLGAGDIDGLVQKFSAELIGRAPNLITRAIAQATPKSATDTVQAMRQTAPAKRAALFGRAKGLFSTTPKPARSAATPSERAIQRPASLTELKAVRAALYATNGSGAGVWGLLAKTRIAAQAGHAVTQLASVPSGLASAMADLRRPQDGRIRQ